MRVTNWSAASRSTGIRSNASACWLSSRGAPNRSTRSLDETRITDEAARAADEGRRAEGAAGRRRDDVYRREATRLVARYLGEPSQFAQAPINPGFDSALEREVVAVDAKALTASDWAARTKALIANGPIKAHEVKWPGLSDYPNDAEGQGVEGHRAGVPARQRRAGDKRELQLNHHYFSN